MPTWSCHGQGFALKCLDMVARSHNLLLEASFGIGAIEKELCMASSCLSNARTNTVEKRVDGEKFTQQWPVPPCAAQRKTCRSERKVCGGSYGGKQPGPAFHPRSAKTIRPNHCDGRSSRTSAKTKRYITALHVTSLLAPLRFASSILRTLFHTMLV